LHEELEDNSRDEELQHTAVECEMSS
jgi:hypothetical protein